MQPISTPLVSVPAVAVSAMVATFGGQGPAATAPCTTGEVFGEVFSVPPENADATAEAEDRLSDSAVEGIAPGIPPVALPATAPSPLPSAATEEIGADPQAAALPQPATREPAAEDVDSPQPGEDAAPSPRVTGITPPQAAVVARSGGELRMRLLEEESTGKVDPARSGAISPETPAINAPTEETSRSAIRAQDQHQPVPEISLADSAAAVASHPIPPAVPSGPDMPPRIQPDAPPTAARPAPETQVAQVALSATSDTTEILLSPEELGSVRIELRTERDGLTVVLQAERPETLDLLRRHSDRLAAELRQAGYTQVDVGFGQSPERQPDHPPSPPVAGTRPSQPERSDAADSGPPPAAPADRAGLYLRI